MGLEVKTSLSQVCLLLPAPCKLEVVILKICLLQFFKSLSNFKVITPYSHKSGSVSSQPCFPAVPTVFDCVRLFQQMIFKCGASFQGLRVSCLLLFFLFCGTLTLLTLHCRQLSLQTPKGTSGNCWGQTSLQQSVRATDYCGPFF